MGFQWFALQTLTFYKAIFRLLTINGRHTRIQVAATWRRCFRSGRERGDSSPGKGRAAGERAPWHGVKSQLRIVFFAGFNRALLER